MYASFERHVFIIIVYIEIAVFFATFFGALVNLLDHGLRFVSVHSFFDRSLKDWHHIIYVKVPEQL